MVIEHVDSSVYLKSKAGVRGYEKLTFPYLVDEVYTSYAINGGATYSYLNNKAGAIGSMQILESTFKGVLGSVSTYGIDVKHFNPEDPMISLQDHIRSAMISMLLCYDNYKRLSRDTRLKDILGTEIGNYEVLLVSNYNGSPRLVSKNIDATIEIARKAKVKLDPETFKTFYIKVASSKEYNTRQSTVPGQEITENGNYLRKYRDVASAY